MCFMTEAWSLQKCQNEAIFRISNISARDTHFCLFVCLFVCNTQLLRDMTQI